MNNWLGDSLEDIVLLPKDIVCSLPWLVLLLFMVTLMRIYFFGGAILNSALYIAFIAGLVILPRAVGMIQKTCHYMAEGNNYAQRTLRSMPIVFVFTAAGVVIYISAMSYLGFGVSPVIPELGQMLGTPVEYLVITLWLILGPAICLTLILTVWVITGEALLERLGFRSRAIWSKTME
jgi:peptide/nickel transport system permease protein